MWESTIWLEPIAENISPIRLWETAFWERMGFCGNLWEFSKVKNSFGTKTFFKIQNSHLNLRNVCEGHCWNS